MAEADFFAQLHQLIVLQDPVRKCRGVTRLAQIALTQSTLKHEAPVLTIDHPGLPESLVLVAPRQLKRRGIQHQSGRNILLHAIAHIEFNAINLALDAAYRFRHQPMTYYQDWLRVAADEARHFGLIEDYLQQHDCGYGHYPAHNGLWEMAVKTSQDVVARMALVPRVMEARGLDVTPAMISKLRQVEDQHSVQILETIYQDEIEHVAIGSKWFRFQCEQRGLEYRETFIELVARHLHGELRGPFNHPARLLAGFDEQELAELQKASVGDTV